MRSIFLKLIEARLKGRRNMVWVFGLLALFCIGMAMYHLITNN